MPEKNTKNDPIAVELAKKQREISISEFFTKNRHLLGFDNPSRALMMTVKEGVDNSLDACEEMKVLPELKIQIDQLSEDRFTVTIEDNGPGIVKKQIPNVFARLLYGSKFHRLRQSLTYDEPIFILRNGKAEIIPIGLLIDQHIGKDNQEVIDVSNLDIKVPAFDIHNKYNLTKVNHLIRHKRENEILKIKTQYGKEVKITGCHSLFSYNNNSKKIESIEARSLKIGDYIVVPNKLPDVDSITEINLLTYLDYNEIKDNWIYVYGIKSIVQNLKINSHIIHKKVDKSRKFYRISIKERIVDVVEESFNQYLSKGFLPLKIIYQLDLINEVSGAYLITYYHGNKSKIPVTINLDKQFMRFLGLYIAEGHSDIRQLGLTFGKHEQKLIDEIINFAQVFGLGFSLEPREKSIRLKLFNNMFVKFITNICNKGAFNKVVPEFVFRTNSDLRWHFIDAYCQGDGHKVKNRNCLTFVTKSKQLAIGLQYLFLMNGVTSSYSNRLDRGLGKLQTLSHKIDVHGYSLNGSHIYSRSNVRPTNSLIYYNNEKATGLLKQELSLGDLGFVKIKDVQVINEGYDYVYDISVPKCENFVGGIGGIACHNSRGQQGIGISAAVLYSQLTTGKPTKITSKIDPEKPAHYYELGINTKTNEPDILDENDIEWEKNNGTRIELELEAKYQKGKQSVDEYLKQTAISNPHANIIYITPEKEKIEYLRATEKLPAEAKEIKPHPHGIELGILIKMLHDTGANTVSGFLQNDFSRIGPGTAKDIIDYAKISTNKPKDLERDDIERLFKSLQSAKVIAPPTDCLSPIGPEILEKGLRKEINADFYATTTRPPSVYRGNPFVIEAGIAYGGELEKEASVRLVRFANRVPLLYQQGACAITEAASDVSWRSYGLQQSGSNLPVGPVLIVVHMASVWVPFTSEAKEAIAHYDEIIKEIKLALQECGRKLYTYLRHNVRAAEQKERISLFDRYIPELASSLAILSDEKKNTIEDNLRKILKKNMSSLLEENGLENDKEASKK